MKQVAKKGMNLRRTVLAVGLLSTMVAGGASAAVVYEDVGFLSLAGTGSSGFSSLSIGQGAGSAVATKVNSFSIATPGQYTASLADFDFPQAFSKVGLAITSFVNGQSKLGEVWGDGQFTFTASAPGTYYASLLAEPSAVASVGLFGVQVADYSGVTAAPVPVPPAILFLTSAVAVFAAFGRGGRKLRDEDSAKRAGAPGLALAA